jgi:hypothetical protein
LIFFAFDFLFEGGEDLPKPLAMGPAAMAPGRRPAAGRGMKCDEFRPRPGDARLLPWGPMPLKGDVAAVTALRRGIAAEGRINTDDGLSLRRLV